VRGPRSTFLDAHRRHPTGYSKVMSDSDPNGAVVVRASLRAQLPALIAIGLIACGYAAAGLTGVIGVGLAVAGIVIFGGVLITGAVVLRRIRRSPWEVRLEPQGVTVRGHEVVPWADFTEVRVTGMRPQWIFWASKLLGYRVVSFIATPGVVVAPLPSFSYRGSFERRAGKVRERWYGSRLVIPPRTTNMPIAAIAAAVRRFSEVPITYA